jgi:hypothetical protein
MAQGIKIKALFSIYAINAFIFSGSAEHFLTGSENGLGKIYGQSEPVLGQSQYKLLYGTSTWQWSFRRYYL